ncbi:hypothetical protein ACFQ1L_35640 [Phytohabitans flavus]|nr:hypothetical protein [Phytohabitans flavus]
MSTSCHRRHAHSVPHLSAVSLRVRARDTAGNAIEQAVLRAYGLR